MKKIILIIAVAAAIAGCRTQQSLTDEQLYRISWAAFCAARGYDIDDNTYRATCEYLDTWCGSHDEEAAFIAAGVQPR